VSPMTPPTTTTAQDRFMMLSPTPLSDADPVQG